MNFEVRALKPDFDRYLQLRQQINPQTGAPYTAGEALAELNCGQLCAPAAITTYPFKTNRTLRSASEPTRRELSSGEGRSPDLRAPDDVLLRRRDVYVILSQEPAGSAALFLTGGLSLIVGTYFRFVARRLEERPEDNPDAEVSDGAGDVGFFSPGSYWPIMLAVSAALVGLSLAFFYIWAVVISGVLLIVAIGGLVFEYHIRPSDH